MADARHDFKIEINFLRNRIAALNARINVISLPSDIAAIEQKIEAQRTTLEESDQFLENLERMREMVDERNLMSAALKESENKSQEFKHISDLAQLAKLIEESQQRLDVLLQMPENKEKEEDNNQIEKTGHNAVDAPVEIVRKAAPISVENQYIKLRTAFRDKLDELPRDASPEAKRFYQRGIELHKAIVAQEKKQNFNARVYGGIFASAAELLSSPGDQSLHKQLSDFSHEKVCGKHVVDGHRSIPKNIFYAVSAFLAAAAVVAVGLGFSVLLPVVSLPAAISCFAVGATLFAGGVLVCVNGRKKGTAKAIDNFEAAAGKLPKPGLFAAPAVDLKQRPTEDVTEFVMK